MTRESKLYPAQIQAQCQSAVSILETDNQNLELTGKAVSAFVNDIRIESVAFDQLKMQCENYIGIISSMKEINSSDIADYNTLSGAVGSEELIGAVILDNKEKYLRLRDEAYVNEETYKNLASQYWWIPSLAAVYMARASYYHIQGEFYDWQYQYWLEKEMEYDNIEAATAGLFANSVATRAALGGMLSALQGAFKMDFGYIPEAVVPAKLQLDCVMMGDADTANGIKALDEYLVQSGKFTQEERAAIISSALNNNPELLKNAGSAIAVGSVLTSVYSVKGIAESYLLKERENHGKRLLIPEPGETISISRGIELPNETAVVSLYHAWSREYSVIGCNDKWSDKLCCKRLNYAIENYDCNSTDDDLLMFNMEGYDEPVFAGAMVEGYADIGDIVEVTLDNNNRFNFLILDVKSTEHTVQELSAENQIQCDWGHGYLLGSGKVQLSVCEFITAGNCSVGNVQDTKSGAFLKKRRVVESRIVDHIQICDE